MATEPQPSTTWFAVMMCPSALMRNPVPEPYGVPGRGPSNVTVWLPHRSTLVISCGPALSKRACRSNWHVPPVGRSSS